MEKHAKVTTERETESQQVRSSARVFLLVSPWRPTEKPSPCDPHESHFSPLGDSDSTWSLVDNKNFRHISSWKVRASNRQLGQDSVSEGTWPEHIPEAPTDCTIGRQSATEREAFSETPNTTRRRAHRTSHPTKRQGSLHRGTETRRDAEQPPLWELCDTFGSSRRQREKKKKKEGRRKQGSKEARKQGSKEARKQGRKEGRKEKRKEKKEKKGEKRRKKGRNKDEKKEEKEGKRRKKETKEEKGKKKKKRKKKKQKKKEKKRRKRKKQESTSWFCWWIVDTREDVTGSVSGRVNKGTEKDLR